MKPVIIIVIAFVFLSSVIIPIMATHEPNYIDQWFLDCKKTYDQQVYIEGRPTDAIERSYDNCMNQMAYPEKPLIENQCYKQYDNEIAKLERAVEVGTMSAETKANNEEYQTQQLQKCIDNAVTKKQLECIVELSNLRYHEGHMADGDGVQEYYDDALVDYNHCMGIVTDSESEPKTQPEVLEEVEIVCGKGTVLIDHICQVEKIEEEKEIPVEKTVDIPVEKAVEKTVDIPVEKPSKKSVNWFTSIFDWLGGLFK